MKRIFTDEETGKILAQTVATEKGMPPVAYRVHSELNVDKKEDSWTVTIEMTPAPQKEKKAK